ncbi:valine--tRNA ligase, partial [Lactobacillus sp. XV13L]|nr:valine--tRNA ligase [Lactobacillus sp. XV13L]
YGADALRWFLLNGTAPGQDTRYNPKKLASAWNFINKVWNASRFVIMNLPKGAEPAHMPDVAGFDLADGWIFDRLNHTVGEVIRLFDEYKFGEAGREMYNFVWNDFCDWYIEMSKVTLNGDDQELKAKKQDNLIWILDQILRLLHPIMPFVTEKLWLSMPHNGKSIMVAKYPETHSEFVNDQARNDMDFLIETIKAVRNIRMEVNAPLSSPIDIMIQIEDKNSERVLTANAEYVKNFLHPKKLTIATTIDAPKLAKTAVISGAQIFVPLVDLVNVDDEISRMEKEEKELAGEVERAAKKLSNQGFVAHAPQAVIDKEKAKKIDYERQLESVRQRIQELRKGE